MHLKLVFVYFQQILCKVYPLNTWISKIQRNNFLCHYFNFFPMPSYIFVTLLQMLSQYFQSYHLEKIFPSFQVLNVCFIECILIFNKLSLLIFLFYKNEFMRSNVIQILKILSKVCRVARCSSITEVTLTVCKKFVSLHI